MTRQELRMRCLECVAGTGVREVRRQITDARDLEDFVLAAPGGDEDKPSRAPKTAGKTAV